MQYSKRRLLLVFCYFIFNALSLNGQLNQWITRANGLSLFERNQAKASFDTKKILLATISVDTTKKYQKMEGFGYTLTGGSAQLIDGLPLVKKKKLLQEIFGAGPTHLGVNYIRVSMGASDLDEQVFSYNDLPKGSTDIHQEKFSLSNDTVHLIPLLQSILKIQPSLKIMASPWSPPTWMKSNNFSMGGSLLKKFYASYALYFVKYIQSMKLHGIPIHAVTIQNEPEHGGNNPSLLMTAVEQKEFVRDFLGPAFKLHQINTEIVIWDHNADHPNYPIEILNDSIAKSYIAATAFHLYLGDESALSKVYETHPDKKIYFTEQWTGAEGSFEGDFMWHMEHIIMGTIQNWSSLVLEWNLASDAAYKPHTPGGCTACKGAFTIQGDLVTRNVSYYIIGQVAKFVPRGSTRLWSNADQADIKTIAFQLPNGQQVLLVLNKGKEVLANIAVNGSNQLLRKVYVPTQSVAVIKWQ